MPITFKSEVIKPITIDKEGTKFHFRINASVRRQANISSMLMGGDNVVFVENMFRKSLIGWDNLIDEKGNQVAFSITVRDLILDEMEIFDLDDIIEVFGIKLDSDKNIKKKNKKSTSKNV